LLVQISALIVIGLVAGATFGIWRGYNPSGFAPPTFLEVHKGAVAGLNTLLPVLGLAANVLTLLLAARFYGSTGFGLFVLALVLMIAAGVITRFGNQPINAQVMGWTVYSMPTNWTQLRDTWWFWHLIRTAVSVAAFAALAAAVLSNLTA
jgi:hypothetical protein